MPYYAGNLVFSHDFVRDRYARHDVAGLIKALRHRDARVRSDAAQALGDLHDARAVEPLRVLCREARDPCDPGVALRALGELGDPSAAPFIASVYFANGTDELGRSALRALARLGGPHADQATRVARGVEQLTDSDPAVCAEAVEGLRGLEPQAVNVLTADLQRCAGKLEAGMHPDLEMGEAIAESVALQGVVLRLLAALEALDDPAAIEKRALTSRVLGPG